MRYIFKFPDIGEGIAEGKIIEWYVKKGQEIKSGDSIVKMETDKVVTDIPSPKDGTIVAVFGNPGDVINVEDPLVEIEIDGVEGQEAQLVNKEKSEPAKDEAVEEKGFGVVGTIEVASDSSFLPAGNEGRKEEKNEKPTRRKALATPVARAMAKDFGIDINNVKGTGPAGRVMKEDIRKYRELGSTDKVAVRDVVQESVDSIEYLPMTQMRKTIARNMAASKQNAAHMTAFEEVEITNLIQLRNKYRDEFLAQGTKLSYLSIILKAATKALAEFPILNSEADFDNERILLKKFYNINIAVDTEDGLVVPVIKNIDKLSVIEISKEIERLAEKARDRKLELDDYKGGTFTVTNYGSIAGTYGVPVINYPQSAILGVGRIMQKPIVKEGEIVTGNILPLSISVDHRIIDGGDTARFLKKLIMYLNDPVSLLLF